jgi:hypothetical protein
MSAVTTLVAAALVAVMNTGAAHAAPVFVTRNGSTCTSG